MRRSAFTVAISSRASTGCVRNASAPASRPCVRHSLVVKLADSCTTGMSASRRSDLSVRSTSKPLWSGSLTSSTIRSMSGRASWSASPPVDASTTSNPAFRSQRETA
jgi:hypothetical protein